MAKYEVIRPWDLSVKVGDIVELNRLHDSLKAHLKLIPEPKAPIREFEVSTPASDKRREK